MGQVLHGSATTTEAALRAIQNSQESLRALSRHYGINQKTVAKWKKRTSLADLPTGPKRAALDGPFGTARSRNCHLPPAHVATSRRLPLHTPVDDPSSDTIIIAPMPSTSWHFSAAGCPRRQGTEEEVQGLSDRLFPR
jgi:hypothetical protein